MKSKKLFSIDRDTVIHLGENGLLEQIEEVFSKVSDLYKIINNNK
jgi:hypothetical protein